MTQLHTANHSNQPLSADTPDERLNFQIQHLLVATERILRQHPAGVNELGLIKALQRPPWQLIGTVTFSEADKLYPVHFLLFHVLYRLRDQLATGGENLDISPLGIRIHANAVVAGSGMPDRVDPLRDFYLDLSGYTMPEESINRMMDDFWAGRSGGRPAAADAHRAADMLGFDTIPVSFDEVKQRFRRAVMRAHPDRGGETGTIQNLNQAFAVLKAHFRT